MGFWPGSIHQPLQVFIIPLGWVDCLFDWCNPSTVSHRNSAKKTNCYIHHNVAGTEVSSAKQHFWADGGTAWERVSERHAWGVRWCGAELDWVNAQQHGCRSGFSPHSPPVAEEGPSLGSLSEKLLDEEIQIHWLYHTETLPRVGARASFSGAGPGLRAEGGSAPSVPRWQRAPLHKAQGGVPCEQNISTLQGNSALSCRRVVFSLREVHQEGLQDTG